MLVGEDRRQRRFVELVDRLGGDVHAGAKEACAERVDGGILEHQGAVLELAGRGDLAELGVEPLGAPDLLRRRRESPGGDGQAERRQRKHRDRRRVRRGICEPLPEDRDGVGVRPDVPGAGKARAYTTYMTIMARLHKKGVLVRRREGKTDYYKPAFERDEYIALRAGSEVDNLVAQYGDAALSQFARQMASLDPARRRALE